MIEDSNEWAFNLQCTHSSPFAPLLVSKRIEGGVRQRLSTLIDKGLHDLKRGRTDRAIGLLTAIHAVLAPSTIESDCNGLDCDQA